MKKEEGSALILSILVLSFFMALSMNLYFIAEKKAERAGIKKKGQGVLNNIDTGSSIGYFELRAASDMVSKKKMNERVHRGVVAVLGDFPNYFTQTNVTAAGTDWAASATGTFSNWSSGSFTYTGDATDIVGNTASQYMWSNTDAFSFGNYKLESVEVKDSTDTTQNLYQREDSTMPSSFAWDDTTFNTCSEFRIEDSQSTVTFEYRKDLEFAKVDGSLIPGKTYTIIYSETWTIVDSGGSATSRTVSGEEVRVTLNTMTWE